LIVDKKSFKQILVDPVRKTATQKLRDINFG